MNQDKLSRIQPEPIFDSLLTIDMIERGHKVLAATDPLVHQVIRALRRGVLHEEADRQECEAALESFVLAQYANIKPEWCEEIFRIAEQQIIEDKANRGEA